MAETDPVTKDSSDVTKWGNLLDKIEAEEKKKAGIPGENEEISAVLQEQNPEIGVLVTKPKRKKEKRISLYLTPERTKQLYELCDIVGIHRSRIDDNDGNAIWQILDYMDPVLQMRNKARDLARAIGLKPEDLK